MARFDISIKGRAKLKLPGVIEALNDDAVAGWATEKAEAIAARADSLAREHLHTSYEAPIYVSKQTKTKKRGNVEAIVFSNPKVHSGTKENPGAPLGDYAQAAYKSLTKAKDAGA